MLADQVEVLGGVGPARAARLRARGLATVLDLLLLVPARYRRLPDPATTAPAKASTATIVGRVCARRRGRLRGRSGGFLELAVAPEGDAHAPPLTLRFYRQQWLFDRYPVGSRLYVEAQGAGAGKPLIALDHGLLSEDEDPAPHFERLRPELPRVPGIAPGTVRQLVHAALAHVAGLADPLPAAVRERIGLVPLEEALRALHAPSDEAAATRAGARILFDRFLGRFLEAAASTKVRSARPIRAGEKVLARIRSRLPFPLTEGQDAALAEILADLARPVAMRRLLQGDVGAGKTAVAVAAALAAVADQGQVLFLAPTEPLARQHAATVGRWLAGSRVRSACLTAETGAAERGEILRALAGGGIDLAFGTHALLGRDVAFARLALVVIDEQHRFGVRQRLAARAKGEEPHLLCLSATPIPRSLCLALLGDLDHSAVIGRPGGRTTPATSVTAGREAIAEVVAAANRGERAYVVFPAIDSEEMPALLREGVRLVVGRGALAALRSGLCHGRQTAEERDRSLAAFREGALDVLLATSVIEVGLDVPEATIMVVVGAERFGLATLHQLRGRVGRGDRPGRCLLVPSKSAPASARARLGVLERETDGFRLAEEDLRLRGPGELTGVRQAGLGGILPVEEGADRELFEAAHALAPELVRSGAYRPGDRGYYDLIVGQGSSDAFLAGDAG